jgi:hypothetical protein
LKLVHRVDQSYPITEPPHNLMQRMGIEALYRRPRTTTSEPGHKIYPYLLRGIEDYLRRGER